MVALIRSYRELPDRSRSAQWLPTPGIASSLSFTAITSFLHAIFCSLPIAPDRSNHSSPRVKLPVSAIKAPIMARYYLFLGFSANGAASEPRPTLRLPHLSVPLAEGLGHHFAQISMFVPRFTAASFGILLDNAPFVTAQMFNSP